MYIEFCSATISKSGYSYFFHLVHSYMEKDTILSNRKDGFRAGGIIIKDYRILLIRQVLRGKEFYTIPGGTWESGETLEETCRREVKEECTIDVEVKDLLYIVDSSTRLAFYFACKYISGELELGGPEKERMNEHDQYFPEWVEIARFPELHILPGKAKEGLRSVLENENDKVFLLVES